MAELTILSGNRLGETFEIEANRAGIGRAADNLVVLNDPSVSGHHCVILRDGSKYTLRDLNSTNGTRLNGEFADEARLKTGDVLRTGEVEIRIDGEDIEPLPAEPESVAPTAVLPGQQVSPAFRARRDTRPLVHAAVALAVLLALAAIGWFLYTLFFKS
ncbi:MAG: FHA domain-containing protein [Lentisphaerae bacterium]|nr:FHA domain-containing protein [Lentisphaerota bacterium]